jgi:hypothetical protein
MMQVSVTPATVTFMLVPASPSVVGNGNLFGADCKVEGPSPLPLTMNIAPCAIPELGSAVGSQLAALMIPLMTGVAPRLAAHPKARAVRPISSRMVLLEGQIISFAEQVQSAQLKHFGPAVVH